MIAALNVTLVLIIDDKMGDELKLQPACIKGQLWYICQLIGVRFHCIFIFD